MELAGRFGMAESVNDLLTERRLRCLDMLLGCLILDTQSNCYLAGYLRSILHMEPSFVGETRSIRI